MRYHDFHFKSTKKIRFYKIYWDPLTPGKKQEIVKERQAGKGECAGSRPKSLQHSLPNKPNQSGKISLTNVSALCYEITRLLFAFPARIRPGTQKYLLSNKTYFCNFCSSEALSRNWFQSYCVCAAG